MKAANKNVDIENLHPELKEIIANVETELGRELIITSGFRDKSHPIEAKKAKPGVHFGDGKVGWAVDVACVGGTEVFETVRVFIKRGCNRIGINRKSNFCHFDIADWFDTNKVKSIWTY